jgi:ATP-dependent DNA helicase RecG
MPNTRQPSSELLSLTGVGPKVERALNRLGLYSFRDLLFHLPARYEDRTTRVDIAGLKPGIPQLLEGEIISQSVIPGRRMQAVLTFEDITGAARIRLFHFSRAYLTTLKNADFVRIFGEPRIHQGVTEFIHPEISVFKGEPPPLDDTLTPIYPTTDGLSQPKLRDIIRQALAKGPDFYALEELLGAKHTKNRPELWDALLALHQPAKGLPASPFVKRLAFEELLAHRLLLLTRRDDYLRFQAIELKSMAGEARAALLQQLPFNLTRAQEKVLCEIDHDLTHGHPMLRLLQGDVGSGKTLVAALAALPVIEAGFQVALMAPTELLSEQHAAQFSEWFRPIGISVGWLTGSMKAQPRRTMLEQLSNGTCQIVIGTHALFQDEIVFKRLGLAIIDEQHRFGVAQRLLLREKGQGLTPHQLIMTATPIPRTLAMTHFADLDVSTIDELPPGRTPVDTRILSQARAPEITARLDAQFDEGGQAYWVCTLIEETEQSVAEAAESRTEKLRLQLPHRRIGLVHGRMTADDKSQVMTAFADGELDLLVATTVIEVGVNVPNANIMVIENPERLGLAQLHQLRGRVGRGARISFCILLAGDAVSQHSRDRLNLLKDTNDGFVLAEADLRLRGPGDVTGTRQTGELSFRVADLAEHADMLDEIAELAEIIRLEHTDIREQLIERWIGHEEHFAHV